MNTANVQSVVPVPCSLFPVPYSPSVRSVVTVGLILAAFLFGALGTAAAQGRGNGGGGGDTSAPTGTPTGWIEQFSDSVAGLESRGWGIEQTGSPD